MQLWNEFHFHKASLQQSAEPSVPSLEELLEGHSLPSEEEFADFLSGFSQEEKVWGCWDVPVLFSSPVDVPLVSLYLSLSWKGASSHDLIPTGSSAGGVFCAHTAATGTKTRTAVSKNFLAGGLCGDASLPSVSTITKDGVRQWLSFPLLFCLLDSLCAPDSLFSFIGVVSLRDCTLAISFRATSIDNYRCRSTHTHTHTHKHTHTHTHTGDLPHKVNKGGRIYFGGFWRLEILWRMGLASGTSYHP